MNVKIEQKSVVKESVPRLPIIAAATILLIGVLLGLWWVRSDYARGIDQSKYQIVTLSNGTAYIGHLSGIGGSYAVLKNVYYQANTKTDTAVADPANEVVVVKLSSTVAKPEDKLRINSSEIMHWANLADDSKIVAAIKQDGQAQ
jgi:hypothetical protein